ncbi:MAG TPA: hypothetical protein VEN82_07295 [Actinomycetota bacterium]|nr:hypothetical protein [Actinomycetota bacterium]
MMRAYFDAVENNATNAPITDDQTVPVGTDLAFNVLADVDAGFPKGAIVVVEVNGPGVVGRWDVRTDNGTPLVVGTGKKYLRVYQQLKAAGDWYFTAKLMTHQGGDFGTQTEFEVHVSG